LENQIKEVPKDMRSKLPAHFYSALEIRAPLKGAALHGTTLELVRFYNLQFEMVFPPLNSPLLIYKHVRDLGLPGMFFPAFFEKVANHIQLKYIRLFVVSLLYLTWTSPFQSWTREHTVFLHIQKSSL
jgi:hypothetical protein